MRALYVAAVAGDRALTDEQPSASLTATLAKKPKGAGWWVFGYGSLLWNPLFPVAEARAAMVRGFHRRFCLQSLASRGIVDDYLEDLARDVEARQRGCAVPLVSDPALP